MKLCKSPVCDRQVWALGMCKAHYDRRARTGTPNLDVPVQPRPSGPSLPIEPLVEFVARHYVPSPSVSHIGPAGMIAAMTGICRTSAARWIARGTIVLDKAEDIADALDVFPTEIWGVDYFEVAA